MLQAHGLSVTVMADPLDFVTCGGSFIVITVVIITTTSSGSSFINMLLVISINNSPYSFLLSGTSLFFKVLEHATLYLFYRFNCVFNDPEKIV